MAKISVLGEQLYYLGDTYYVLILILPIDIMFDILETSASIILGDLDVDFIQLRMVLTDL